MSAESIHGLTCPRCGGIVPIPEGHGLVICPYCDMRSVVAAQAGSELGIRRYQAPLRVDRQQAINVYQQFLTGKVQIARDCAKQAQLNEVFLVHLPFWSVWARGVAWAFGQQRVGSGKNQHYEPREKKVIRDFSWNSPACAVGEFGVQRISLQDCPLEPFDAAGLHRTGMVFEPVGSDENVLQAASAQFDQEIRQNAELSRTEQIYVRLTNARLGLVYYPLWVLRYLYHGRSFQVVVDGFTGQVLYGKAPGSIGYRAAVLVGGMAAGAFLAIDVPIGLLAAASSSDDEGPFLFALAIFAGGVGLMFGSFHTFRHAEHYEYHRYKAKRSAGNLTGGVPLKALADVIDQVENQ